MPVSAASDAASDEGADTAASTGTPIMTAFCASSNEARPLTSRMCPARGSRPERSAQPASLSTALCRPTSSRSASSAPSAVNSPAACRPPVLLKTRCASRSWSGSPASTAGETWIWSAATSKAERTRIASMLSLPHTPHALVAMKFLDAVRSSAPPGPRVTAAVFSSHIRISRTSPSPASRPSVNRKPAARSMSCPGVRMVTISGSPSTWISSGSSIASRSARSAAAPDTGTLSTRRLAVVPLMSPRLPAVSYPPVAHPVPDVAPPVLVGDDLGGQERVEVPEHDEDDQDVRAHDARADRPAQRSRRGRAEDQAQAQDDGEDEEGLELQGVVVELGPGDQGEPGAPAGQDAEQDGAGPPVAVQQPPAQAEQQGQHGAPPDGRGAERQHLLRPFRAAVVRRAVVGRAGHRGLVALVEERDRPGDQQPVPRLGLVRVRGAQAHAETDRLPVVLEQRVQGGDHRGMHAVRRAVVPEVPGLGGEPAAPGD